MAAIEDLVARTLCIRHKERKFGRGCVERWREDREEMRAKLNHLLERFDRILSLRPFFLGDQPQYVDFALYGVIGNYTYQGYNELSANHEALRSWCDRFADYRFEQ